MAASSQPHADARLLPACQSPHHAPLWCRGKWVVGVEPLITGSREHKPPWGMCRVTLLSSLHKILFAIFFHPGWTTAFLCREGTRTSDVSSSRTDKEMSPAADQTTQSSAALDVNSCLISDVRRSRVTLKLI